MLNKTVILLLISLLFLFVKGIAGDYVGLLNSMSLIFVGLGTLLCLFLSVTLDGLKKVIGIVFRKRENRSSLIDRLVDYSSLIYQGSDIIQSKILSENDHFAKSGLMKVYEGILSEEELESTLRKKIQIDFLSNSKYADRIRSLIKYPTVFGLLGTLLALVAYLNHQSQLHEFLGTPAEIIEFGLMSSIYGFLISYFIFLPFAEKLERSSEEKLMNNKVVLEALILMRKRTNPTIVREILSSYLEDTSEFGNKKYEYEKA